MSKYLDRAKEIRAIVEPHHNCAQSVLMSFTQSLKLDDETAYKIATTFGGGMKSGITCGVSDRTASSSAAASRMWWSLHWSGRRNA